VGKGLKVQAWKKGWTQKGIFIRTQFPKGNGTEKPGRHHPGDEVPGRDSWWGPRSTGTMFWNKLPGKTFLLSGNCLGETLNLGEELWVYQPLVSSA